MTTLTFLILAAIAVVAIAAVAYVQLRTVDTTVPASKPASRAAPVASSNMPTAVRTWGYQLQNLDVARASASRFDLIVIDPAKDGSDDTALSPAEVTRLKAKPDGSRRLVLAYLSIGEAESYRGYWRPEWKRAKPPWLLAENPEWKENYAVCFWDPGWQAIMCGSPEARLDRILAAGFDGVYLDKCDVFEDMREHKMKEAKARPDLEADMTAFITRLATYARAKRPGFLVVMQNAESLLERSTLRRQLDGIAKEELVFGLDGPEKKNAADEFEWSRTQLDRMQREGKLVLVVEYLSTPTRIAEARRIVEPLGYALFISPKDRELKTLPFGA